MSSLPRRSLEIYSELEERFGEEDIERVAEVMLQSELNLESGKFTALFEALNREYFGVQLPAFAVRVAYDADPADDGERLIIDRGHKTIRLRMSRRYDDYMLHGLVHAMAHLATNDLGGPEWKQEMIRLRDAGAPVPDWEISDCSFRIVGEAGRRIAIPIRSDEEHALNDRTR